MKITQTLRDGDKEIRLTHEVEGELLGKKNVNTTAAIKEGEAGWRNMDIAPSKENLQKMSVEQYAKEGRPEIYKHLSAGKLMACRQEALEITKAAEEQEIAKIREEIDRKNARIPVKFPIEKDGFEFSYRVEPEQEVDKEAYFKSRLGYTDEEFAQVQEHQWFRVIIEARAPGKEQILGMSSIKACSAPDSIEFVVRDQAGGNLEAMIEFAKKKALELEPNKSTKDMKASRGPGMGI